MSPRRPARDTFRWLPAAALVPLLGVVAGVVALAGCGPADDTGPETVERSTFVAAYVGLRVAALRTEGVLDAGRRDAILAEHGVTGDELLEFAEVHGRDAAYMRDVWSEVEQRLDSARRAAGEPEVQEPGDTAGPGGAGGEP